MMTISKALFVTVAVMVVILSTIGLSYENMLFASEEDEACILYDQTENTIAITCDHASFEDVVDTINDPAIIESLGDGEYLLKANLRVNDGITFAITSDDDDLQYLKIAGTNGIIVNGKIQINGVKITSWDASANDVVQQNINGSIGRAYVQFAASEGAEILNSEFAYLGYVEPGRRGFDLFGDGGGISHDMEIRGNKFHHMWRAFYSTGAYDITIDGNEYHHNINYGVDPHSGTHDINITNNWIHHNRIGIICSNDCYSIMIDGNKIDHNTNAGIFFSRNMQDSIARNNHLYNSSTGIVVSESSDNQIYNNTIEATTSEALLLFNPAEPDDGLTTNNLIHNNTISESTDGINATRSHDNILGDNTFSHMRSSEYHLSRNSSIKIVEQDFHNASITTGKGLPTGNIVEIVNSGIIEVVEVNGREVDSNNDQRVDEENYYNHNTDRKPYRKVFGGGDSIIVNSSTIF
jgi:mannuronan 5-epimerase